ncbi:hypothetical protein [Paenibacillus xerothermodurans]|nr:hypothetical protein [Paenibacillus xerothermodurans]
MDTNTATQPEQAREVDPMASDAKVMCQRYMNYHVIAHARDGSQFDGIVEGMDEDGVTMLLPEEVDADEDRQFGYGRRRFRRHRRRRFPFYFFAFPYFTPYPYYYPPYPQQYPYPPYYPGYDYGYGYGYDYGY